MRIYNASAHSLLWRSTCIAVLYLIVAAGPAGAETFHHGGSTATIEQAQGSGASKTQVIRHRDRQTLITQDGSSTDIVTQAGAGPHLPDDGRKHSPTSPDRFDVRSLWERFSGVKSDRAHAVTGVEYETSHARREFKRRMLDRIQSP